MLLVLRAINMKLVMPVRNGNYRNAMNIVGLLVFSVLDCLYT